MLNTGLLNDPLKDWGNDDLLLTEESRARLQATRPRLLRVFDWPELRDAFARHDGPAGAGKRWSHRQGVASVLFSGLGVILLSLLPVLREGQAFAMAFALASMFLGGIIGILHWGLLKSKHDWLGHRFWTERLRQLHFQSLVNNLDLVAAAMNDDLEFDRLTLQRRIWLADMYHHPGDPRSRIRAIKEDKTEVKTWIRYEWEANRMLATTIPEIDDVLEGLYRLRIQIQESYSSKNLGMDVYSAPARSRYLKGIVNSCYILAALVGGGGLVSMLFSNRFLEFDIMVWTMVTATATATGLMAQSINQGLQNEADLDRYEWYAEEVEEIGKLYASGDRSVKIEALRRLERAAYKELRLFIRTHSAARFTN